MKSEECKDATIFLFHCHCTKIKAHLLEGGHYSLKCPGHFSVKGTIFSIVSIVWRALLMGGTQFTPTTVDHFQVVDDQFAV